MDLFILHHDPAVRTSLIEGLSGRRVGAYRCDAKAIAGWRELKGALDESGVASAVLLDPRHGLPPSQEDAAHPEVLQMLSAFPTTAFLALLPVSREMLPQVAALGRLGVGVVALGHNDTPEGIARALNHALVRKFREALVDLGIDALPGHGPAILGAAGTTTVEKGDVGRMAEILQVSVPTLVRWCRAARLPPPGKLLAWGRVLMAANLLDNSGRSISGVADAVGYAADSGLRRVFAQFLEASPSELRRTGAFERAKSRFLVSLAER